MLKEQIDTIIICAIIGIVIYIILAYLMYWSLNSKDYEPEENPQPVKRTYSDNKYKPVREWINKLPADVYQRAVDRCNEQNECGLEWVMNHETRSLQGALMIMFDWEDTPEGNDYWKSIVDQYSVSA